MTLLKDRHPQADLFIPDIFDNIGASFKDDMASMEHPIFSLSKKRDMRRLEYKRDNVRLTISPSSYGLPTILDKDVLLYCASLLMTEVNAGRIPPRTLRVSCRDILKSTNRPISGESYDRLKNALDRLQGVAIKTNIKTNKREVISAFGVFDSYEIIESSKVKNRMIRLEITVSEWFYNSVLGKEVLTINRDYFRLGKPMERRLYEIARKHCGNQPCWKVGLTSLMEKTGSTSTLRLFRSRLKVIAKDDHIPDYSLALDAEDNVTFTQKNTSQETQQSLSFDDIPRIHPKTIDKARTITQEAGTGWDFYALQSQFTESLMNGSFKPDNVDGAFINFVKKKVENTP